MQILIDNLDGNGLVDYSSYLSSGTAAFIKRSMNKVGMCEFALILCGTALSAPIRGGRLQLLDASGVLLFSGIAVADPARNISGALNGGASFITSIVGLSDESALDAGAITSQRILVGQTAGQQWNAIATQTGQSVGTVVLSEQVAPAGRVEVRQGARFTEAAAALASSTGSVYRVDPHGITVTPLGAVSHTISLESEGLQFATVSATDLPWLAEDVIVCGRQEPTAYVTEVFQGDGITTLFALTQRPFTPAAAQKTTIRDLFQGTSLNSQMWVTADTGNHLALTAGGLTCMGGTGREAETTISAVQQVELGGSITLEANGVYISSGSVGVLLGIYAGTVRNANCICGFSVSTVSGEVTISPLLNGGVAGASFSPQSNHLYTLRLRVVTREMQRMRQAYLTLSDAGAGLVGGEAVTSGGYVEFEVQDVTSGIPGAPTTLFAGSVGVLPPSATIGLMSSGSLSCSVKSFSCVQGAPLQIAVQAGSAQPVVQVEATLLDGGACRISSQGALTFYPGNVPPADALIYVNYRIEEQSAARQASLTPSGSGSSVMWVGSVSEPITWSSVDCEHAALALIRSASSGESAVMGSYTFTRLQGEEDIWPGDALLFGPTADGKEITAFVRDIEIEILASFPEALQYKARFANDRAEGLGLKLSSSIPKNVVLPQAPTSFASALQSLVGLTVTSVTGSAVTLDMGVNPPVNGGFEIRRRDNTFGPGSDSDLVLRVNVAHVTLSRLAPVEQYYIRMYDGSTPVRYSLFSAAVFLNVPIA